LEHNICKGPGLKAGIKGTVHWRTRCGTIISKIFVQAGTVKQGSSATDASASGVNAGPLTRLKALKAGLRAVSSYITHPRDLQVVADTSREVGQLTNNCPLDYFQMPPSLF
jgi:hypothetical protein